MTNYFKSDNNEVSQESLEHLCIAISNLKNDKGLLLVIRPKDILQEWALKKLRHKIPGDLPPYLKEYIIDNFGEDND